MKPLTETEAKILKLKLEDMGQREIADRVGLAQSTVCEHINKPHVQEHLAEAGEETVKRARTALRLATEKVVNALVAKAIDGDARALVAVLDRANLGPSSTTELTGPEGSQLDVKLAGLSFKELKALREAGKK